MVAIPIILFGGGWASIAGKTAFARGAGIELAVLSRRLRPESVAAESADQAAAAARALVRASRLGGVDAAEAIEAAFPEPRSILGMLALDRDIEDFLDYASRKDALGDYYRDQARISREMRPFRARYEAVFAAACAAIRSLERAPGAAAGRSSSVPDRPRRPYIAAPEDVWMPQESALRHAHPYALDVFFRTVDREGEAERGPVIRALFPGIVVATASDWSGGPGPSAWRGGGLSPAAGNGLVIYDPSDRVYCSYFHMSSVAQRSGSVVPAGATLGRGGNSGMNARKQGHGGHVHVEVFDAARDAPLSSPEILELLKR